MPAYSGLRYPLFKDESQPVPSKHHVTSIEELSLAIEALRNRINEIDETPVKGSATPSVGHELFKNGTLTDKVPQCHLHSAGKPEPETVRIAPLYQITVEATLVR